MTRDDIIRMAREAEISQSHAEGMTDFLERFATLVAAAERNRTWTQAHWTEYERSIAAAEREACAKVCEAGKHSDYDGHADCAAAIRARGQA
jgi:hypothetical protein